MSKVVKSKISLKDDWAQAKHKSVDIIYFKEYDLKVIHVLICIDM